MFNSDTQLPNLTFNITVQYNQRVKIEWGTEDFYFQNVQE